MSTDRSDVEVGSEGHAPAPDEHLDLALRGRLPCVYCGYDLKGISIRGVCPECGSAVRATILYTVDPKAEEFQPINHPRLASTALLLWSGGALIASLGAWWPRLADVAGRVGLTKPSVIWADWLTIGAASVSGLAILALIKPMPSTTKLKSAYAMLAIGAHIPIVLGIWWIRFRLDPRSPSPYLDQVASEFRLWASLMIQLAIVAAILGIRPTAREFVQRSKAMRTGSVGRQTLLTMVVVVLLAACATLARMGATRLLHSSPDLAHVIDLLAQLVTALAWLLFTIGTVTALRDTIRLRKVILMPAPSLKDVIHGPADPLAG